MPGFDTSAVEGLETYWASEPHVAFGPSYVDTVSLNDAGRGAASVQVRCRLDEIVLSDMQK